MTDLVCMTSFEGESPPEFAADISKALVLTIPTSRWRVKLYQLESGSWIDHGTGLCWGEIRDKGDAYLVVEDEMDPERKILESCIQGSIIYQKQDTLIIWNEASDSDKVDLALSFQELAGCLVLCQYLAHLRETSEPNIDVAVVVSGTDTATESITDSSLALPPLPTRDNLTQVSECISRCSQTQYGRDCLIVCFDLTGYIERLFSLFSDVEDDNSLESSRRLNVLHQLATVLKAIFMMGETSIIDKLVGSTGFFEGVIGVMEYDPQFGTRKANYRSFYSHQTKFKEVVPISDPTMLNKIQRTFRLQLLKDVILARALDDTTFQLVATHVYLGQMEIVLGLQSSHEFCSELFALFRSTQSNEAQKRDALRFLNTIMVVSKGFPLQQRLDLYERLLQDGLLRALDYGIRSREPEERSLAFECLGAIVDFDPGMLQGPESKYTMMAVIEIFDVDNERPALLIQAAELIKPLLGDAARSMTTSRNAESYFTAWTRQLLSRIRPEQRSLCLEISLDLLGFCFSVSPEKTGEIVSSLKLWNVVSEIVKGPVGKPVLLACFRCLKWCIVNCESQAESIADSGILRVIVEVLVSMGNVNNAVNSAGLELLRLIAEGKLRQCVILRHWLMQRVGDALVHLNYCPYVSSLIDPETSDDDDDTIDSETIPADDSEVSRISLKRPVDEDNNGDYGRERFMGRQRLDEPRSDSPPLEPGGHTTSTCREGSPLGPLSPKQPLRHKKSIPGVAAAARTPETSGSA